MSACGLRRCCLAVTVMLLWTAGAGAQTISQRGFAEGTAFLFPQQAPNDPTRVVGDLLAREEVFFKPAPWLQFAGGLDVRANSHQQVECDGLDFSDRTAKRPCLSVRRLAATLTRRGLTVDVGKQFIRWGKTDIVTPTDRFAPRDFINVINSEFLAVTGVRAVLQAGEETFEGVWVPRFTPSRTPLFDQRWTVVPSEAAHIPVVDGGAVLAAGAQAGVRWSHVGSAFEYALSFFNGFNNLPNIIVDVLTLPTALSWKRIYPAIRTYGADTAVPTRWFTLKGEAAYFTSSTPGTDEYVVYVIQLERQTGEWIVVGGYAGEVVTIRRASLTFAPDRALTRAVVARASYTIDPNRTVAFEGAVRQNGDGLFSKVEYSVGRGEHLRATVTGVVITGDSSDLLGQYNRNSQLGVAVRYSF
jgi:hypothetical protein